MHSHQDYINFIANSELASRGYTVLGSSVPSEDNIEPKMLAVKNTSAAPEMKVYDNPAKGADGFSQS